MKCFFVLDCGTPPTVKNAAFEVSGSDLYYLNGTTITYTCQSGMRILPEGSNTVTCKDSGEWSTDIGKCYSGKRNFSFIVFKKLLFKKLFSPHENFLYFYFK